MQSVDALISSIMHERQIPGLALAVVADGALTHMAGYGVASLELDAPVTPETMFQSASVGKQFTAAAIMLLVEDGLLALDAPLTEYLGLAEQPWASITLRHLLTHTSGVADYLAAIDWRRDYTDAELLSGIAALPPLAAPGVAWRYSNTGYLLLGLVIQATSGRPYGDLLAERIFGPLGMVSAQVNSLSAIIPQRAQGYELVDGRHQHPAWVSPTLSATADGSLQLSLRDLLAWDAALSAGRVLQPASMVQCWSPVQLNAGASYPYGFGWFIGSAPGRRLVEHEGHWQGFNTHILRHLDWRLSVIVLANLSTAQAKPIAHQVAALFLPADDR